MKHIQIGFSLSKSLFKGILVYALLLTILFACNNADDPAPNGTSNPDLLKTWKVSQVLEETLNITSEFTQYRITFAESGADKTYTLVDRQGTSSTGSWSLSTDGITLNLTPLGGTVITLTGVTISVSELKYVVPEASKTGIVTLSFTLVPA